MLNKHRFKWWISHLKFHHKLWWVHTDDVRGSLINFSYKKTCFFTCPMPSCYAWIAALFFFHHHHCRSQQLQWHYPLLKHVVFIVVVICIFVCTTHVSRCFTVAVVVDIAAIVVILPQVSCHHHLLNLYVYFFYVSLFYFYSFFLSIYQGMMRVCRVKLVTFQSTPPRSFVLG